MRNQTRGAGPEGPGGDGRLSGSALLRAHAVWTRSLLGPVSAKEHGVMPVAYPAAA
ncbi:hypothetical protein [Embleya sp. NPDC020630]|uniref:hypothetical protein n=1 Tax=Embleya sp. NPDC020630 TaxID=3363979 RepID=UPI00379D87B4